MKVNAVILNYNDADTVETLVHSICGYESLEHIILVDNHSQDDSRQRLQRLARENEKIQLVFLEENGGYGKGNNAGVRFAVRENQADYVLISNPDVMFSEECLKKMLHVFESHPDVAAVTARMEDARYGTQKNVWPLRGFWGELLSMGPVSRRLFRPFLEYPERRFQGKKAVYTDAVHGSLFLVDGKKFLTCGGYDEGIFLYQEEAVLAQRFRKAGYRSVLLLNCSYRHEHSVSISKSFQGELERQRLREESVLYYMQHYLSAGSWKIRLAKCWFRGIRMEIRAARMAEAVLALRRKNI